MKTTLISCCLLLAFGMLATLPSCSSCKDPQPEPQKEYGSLKVQFSYVWGSNQEPWELNKTVVHSKTGDTLTFSMLRYYVSNIKLKKADGTWWIQPDSYHLLDATTKDSSAFTVGSIPVGEYTGMEYTMGVDSEKNVSGVYTGELSLSHGMYWDWSSGFIMLKAEGTSPNSSVNVFAFHLGGFSGDQNIVTVKSVDFGDSKLNIAKNQVSNMEFIANPARLWHSSPSLSVKSSIHVPGLEAKTMAKDFYNAINFAGIK